MDRLNFHFKVDAKDFKIQVDTMNVNISEPDSKQHITHFGFRDQRRSASGNNST